MRGGSVRRLLRRAWHPSQRQARARREHRRSRGRADRVPGLPEGAGRRHPAPTLDGFTPEQQFFIAWGQFRGDAIRPETQRLMVQTDPHPIAQVPRDRAAVEHAGVREAFACPAGSPMVRPAEKRCRSGSSRSPDRGPPALGAGAPWAIVCAYTRARWQEPHLGRRRRPRRLPAPRGRGGRADRRPGLRGPGEEPRSSPPSAFPSPSVPSS